MCLKWLKNGVSVCNIEKNLYCRWQKYFFKFMSVSRQDRVFLISLWRSSTYPLLMYVNVNCVYNMRKHHGLYTFRVRRGCFGGYISVVAAATAASLQGRPPLPLRHLASGHRVVCRHIHALGLTEKLLFSWQPLLSVPRYKAVTNFTFLARNSNKCFIYKLNCINKLNISFLIFSLFYFFIFQNV